MRVERYTPADRTIWDEFVGKSKNVTFLLQRGYMDYHADRFPDHSLMLYDDSGELVSLLPATVKGDVLSSHAGLTYGGFVMTERTSGVDPLVWLDAVTGYCRSQGFSGLVYKPVPHIYHRIPADEDLYALFRNDAKLTVRNLATAIDMRRPVASSRLGKRAAKRQRRFGISVEEVDDVNLFWQIIVDDRRVRHNTVPVHTAEELESLHAQFPSEIRFFIARHEGEIVAGAVIYVCNDVLHLQYAACTPEGKAIYATDVIYHDIIFNRIIDAAYFDFGTSNEDGGRYLNAGMVAHKEEFGGRSVIYDTYFLSLSK